MHVAYIYRCRGRCVQTGSRTSALMDIFRAKLVSRCIAIVAMSGNESEKCFLDNNLVATCLYRYG